MSLRSLSPFSLAVWGESSRLRFRWESVRNSMISFVSEMEDGSTMMAVERASKASIRLSCFI